MGRFVFFWGGCGFIILMGFFFRMCREILNTCVRNTEEAERASKGGAAAEGGQRATASGMGTETKGVWGMIEESELAKSIRLDQRKKVRACCLKIYILMTFFWFHSLELTSSSERERTLTS